MPSEKFSTLLRSKNLSFVEKKTLFIGIVASAIFSRRNFKKNEDLHRYVSIYENEFNIINVRTKEPGFASGQWRHNEEQVANELNVEVLKATLLHQELRARSL